MIKYKRLHAYMYITHYYNSLTITTFYNMKKKTLKEEVIYTAVSSIDS